MRLGVSPAASTPTGVSNQRFEALFPRAGALGCLVCFAPPLFLPAHLCADVGLRGLLVVALPAPVHPTIRQSLGPAVRLRPSYRSELFFLYLLGCQTSVQFDFLSVLVVF